MRRWGGYCYLVSVRTGSACVCADLAARTRGIAWTGQGVMFCKAARLVWPLRRGESLGVGRIDLAVGLPRGGSAV